jgi:lipoprotein NlpI
MRNADAYLFRASIRRAQGDRERAVLEYDAALKLDPTHREALRARARMNFLLDRYDAADRDYTALVQVQHIPIDAIWLQMTRARRGLDARETLEQELRGLKEEAWPASILRFYLGRIDREALMASASAPDDKERKGRECEARYYAAERLLVEGAKADAVALLEQAARDCPRNFIEYDSALAQLNKPR